ncbi:MAG: hypothetical protein R3E68_01335 [Burkholderiaceae bacterium]
MFDADLGPLRADVRRCYCANGIVYAIPQGFHQTWRPRSMDAFMLDKEANIKLAEKYWGEKCRGPMRWSSGSVGPTMKVDHYKSGKELAEMVAAAKAR